MLNQQIIIYPTHYVLGKTHEDSFIRGRTMSGKAVTVYLKDSKAGVSPRNLALAKSAEHYCVAEAHNGLDGQTGGALLVTGALQVNQHRIIAEKLRIFAQDKEHQLISGTGFIDVNRRPAALVSAEQSLAEIKRRFLDGSSVAPTVIDELRNTLKDPSRYSYEAVITHHSRTFNFTPTSSVRDVVTACKDIMSHMGSAELPVEFMVRVFRADGSVDQARSSHVRAKSLESLNRYMTPCEVLESLTQSSLPAMKGCYAQIIPAQRFSLGEDAIYSLLNNNDFCSLVPENGISGLFRELRHMVFGSTSQKLSARTVVSDIATLSEPIGICGEVNHDLMNCYHFYGQNNSGFKSNLSPLNVAHGENPAASDPEDINYLMSHTAVGLDLLPKAEIINTLPVRHLSSILGSETHRGIAASIAKKANQDQLIAHGANRDRRSSSSAGRAL